jgi:2-haloacid dehalogenase
MIKTVLFDLDDTVLDFHLSEKKAIAKTFIDLDIPHDETLLKRYSEINLSRWKLLEKGEITREEVLLSRFQILFSEIGKDLSPFDANDLYRNHLSEGYDYIEGAEEMLNTVCKDYCLYIVSNGSTIVQEKRIRGSGVGKYFKGIFISEKIGYNKPDVKFFDYCFSRIPGFQKDTAIIIGDSPSSDILGGKNAGIKTCRFNPKGEKGDADFLVQSLSEIPELLKRL